MKILRKLIFATPVFTLSSCGMLHGPDHERPELLQKIDGSNARNNRTAKEAIRPDWWPKFDDTFLNQLINRTVESNLDQQRLTSHLKRVSEISIKYLQIRQFHEQTLANQRSLSQQMPINDVYHEQQFT